MVVKRGYPPPIDLASDRGPRPARRRDLQRHHERRAQHAVLIGKQIPVKDRWAIVTWVRVLQHSQHARIDDVPEAQRGNIAKESGTP